MTAPTKWTTEEREKLARALREDGYAAARKALPHRSLSSIRAFARYGEHRIAADRMAAPPPVRVPLRVLVDDTLPEGRVVARRGGKSIAMAPVGALAVISAALAVAEEAIAHPLALAGLMSWIRREAAAIAVHNARVR